jgi:hypothetical protein
MTALPPLPAGLPARASLWPLDPATYQPHAVHRQDTDRVWRETNCYVDLWIEILHAAGVEPLAACAFTFALDFEGDQWTFFKFPLGDLQRLYGLDTQELAIWKSPALHALEQVHRGRLVMMEVDSFFLPDTAGTAYKKEHVKTTVGIQEIDFERRRLGYFHNAGYHAAEGEDFAGLFRLDDPWTPASLRLLPYTEFVKLDALERRPPAQLAATAVDLLRGHLARRPKQNPFTSYKPRLAADVDWLRGAALEDFHLYAFASMRQFGACFELAGDFLRWLGRAGELGDEALAAPTADCVAIANEAKALQFKLARAVTLKRPLDPGPALDGLAARWESLTSALAARFGA